MANMWERENKQFFQARESIPPGPPQSGEKAGFGTIGIKPSSSDGGTMWSPWEGAEGGQVAGLG